MNRLGCMLLGVGSAFAWCTMGCAVEPGDEELIRNFEQELAAKSSTFWHAEPGSRTVNIPVCFSGGNSTERALVEAAAKEWTDLSSSYGAKFTGWGDCPFLPPFPYKITIYTHPLPPPLGPTGGKVDELGTAGSEMTLYRNSNGNLSKSVAMHEFGHLLGFSHEANRSDSPCDDTQGTNGDLGITAYDPNSIMNYCNNVSSLSSLDKSGYLGVYGGSVVPTTGTPLLGIRNSKSDDYLDDFGTAGSLYADETRFKIVKDNGTTGSLVHDDVIHIKNVGINKYLKSYSGGAVGWVSSKGSSTKWRVKRKSVGSGTVRSMDEVNFRSMVSDKYLRHEVLLAPEQVFADATSTTGYASWRILVLPEGSNVYPLF